MKKLFVVTAALFSALTAFSGCGAEIEYSTKQFNYFNMNAEAYLVVTDRFTEQKEQSASSLDAELKAALTEIENSLSVTISASPISRFNSAQAGETIQLDEISYEVFNVAKDIFNLTEGFYNPAVYYSVQAYGFDGNCWDMTAEDLPSDEEVEQYRLLASHFGEIRLYTENGAYYAVKPQATAEVNGKPLSMKIDLGGIGKGYAVDRANELMEEYGFSNGYFNFGSSSIACKSHYKNGSYELSFTSPRYEDGYYGQSYMAVRIENKCLSTSGDYEQYYEIDGVRYCHIIDPTTGKPTQTGVMTATIIGGKAAEDDALTTAIMAMGKEKAVEFINQKLSDRKVVFTYDNGGNYEIITNFADGEFKVISENFNVVSKVVDGKIVLGD